MVILSDGTCTVTNCMCHQHPSITLKCQGWWESVDKRIVDKDWLRIIMAAGNELYCAASET